METIETFFPLLDEVVEDIVEPDHPLLAVR
jgi:hypothetical protein